MGIDDEDGSDDTPSRMSFLDHLDELRRRIIYALYGLLFGAGVAYFFIRDIQAEIMKPLQLAIPNGVKFQLLEPLEGFMFTLKSGALVALLIASPFIMLQVWYFVAPGLYSKEKRLAVPFVASSTALFLSGAYFGHRIAFPWTFSFLAGYTSEFMQFAPSISSTFSMYVKVILGLGLVFQMPVIVFVLARFGIVSAKFLIKKIKYAVLIILVVAAVISPGGDVVTMLTFAAPMMVLYVISIGVAWLFAKKRRDD